MLVHALQSYMENLSDGKHNFDKEKVYLFSKYQLIVSSILMANLPRHFPGTKLQIIRKKVSYFVVHYWIFVYVSIS